MASKKIGQGFAVADWEIDDGFSVHPLIEYSGDNLSVLFYPEMRRAKDPMFEVLDYLRNVAYQVREMPTPWQAGELLEEHGGPPEEERGYDKTWFFRGSDLSRSVSSHPRFKKPTLEMSKQSEAVLSSFSVFTPAPKACGKSARVGGMSDEEGHRKPEARSPEFRGVEARPRNWLVPVILLMLREWNSYGYELMERATSFGFEAMNPGTLYRTLRQLEKNGLCKSEWETSRGGPARRMYSITDAGEAYLDFWAEALEQYRNNMDAFFRLYTARPRQTDE